MTLLFGFAQGISTPAVAAIGLKPGPGQYYPVMYGVAGNTTIAAGGSLTVQVTGVGGVPAAAAVSSVALNLMARGVNGTGSLVVYPSGATAPATRAASYRSNVDDATLITAKTGADGKVVIKNAGSVAAVVSADIHGYTSAMAQAAAGSTFAPLPPARILSWLAIPANSAYVFAPLGQGGLPSGGVSQVALTITAIGSTAGSLTLYPNGTTRPSRSNLPYGSGSVTQNLAVIKLGSDGKAAIHNSGSADVIVWADVAGYLTDPASFNAGSAAVPLSPVRIASSVSIAAGGTYTLSPLGLGGVPASGVTAVGLALTARSAQNGTLRVYPSGVTDPATHSLNYLSNTDATAFVATKLGSDGKVVIKSTGTAVVTVQIDVYVYYNAPGKPSAPTGVRAIAGDKAALVVWQPSTSDGGATIGAYVVQASPGGQTVWAAGDATATFVTGLTNGQEYTFTVVAITGAGGGTGSDLSAPSLPVTPLAPAPPGTPLITNTYPRDGAVRVSWSPPDTGTAGLTKYVVTASPGGATVEAAPDATQAVVSGLTNGTLYTFTVSAVNAQGTGVSVPSRPLAPELARTPLSPPLTQVIALNQRIELQWAAPADGGAPITGYTVTASPGGPTLTIPAGTTVAALTGLINDRSYTVSVTASNKAGASAPTVRTAVTPRAARVPEPPTGVRAGVTATGSVEVSWMPPVDVGTSPIGGYGIQAIPGPIGTIAAPGTSKVTLTGLDPAIAYSFVVIAVNSAGQSAPSAQAGPVKPKLTVKSAPVVLSAASVSTLRQIHPDGTLDFEAPPAEVTNLAPGNVVVLLPSAIAPNGFFAKVSAINRVSGLFVVSTEDASLTDTFDEAAFAVSTPVSAGGIASFEALTPGVEQSKPSIGPSVNAEGSITIRDGAVVINIEHEFEVAEATNAGKIEATLTLKPNLDIDGSVSIGGDVTTDTSLSLTATAQAKGTIGPISWTTEIPLAKVKDKCWDIQIGPLPLLVCPEFTAKIKVTVTAGAGVDIDVKYGREVGAHIHTHNTDVEATKIDNVLANDPPILRPFGTFGVTFGVPVDATLYFYNIGGPGGKVEPYIKGILDTRANPCWTISAGVTLDVWVKTRKFLGFQLEWTREKLVDESWVLRDSGGPCQGIRVTPETARTGVGQAAQFALESLGGVPLNNITWKVVSGPGAIDNTGRYVYNGNGYAIVEATRAASGGLPEYTSRGGVVTGTPAPGKPTITKVTAGPFSAEVSWSAPPAIPGQTITKYAVITSPLTRTTYVDGSQTKARIAGLTEGKEYYVRVTAIAGNITGTPSLWEGPVIPKDAFARIGSRGDLGTGDVALGSALSGNGRYLFLIVYNGSTLAPPEIYVAGGKNEYLIRFDLQTGDVVLASRDASGAPLRVHGPAGWADYEHGIAPTPDGTKVAFVSELSRDLYMHDLSARTTRLIWDGQPHDFAISDNGSVVTYSAYLTSGRHLFRTVNGGAPQQVDGCSLGTGCDSAAGNEMSHDLSGDGNKIIYQDFNDDPVLGKQSHIMLYNAADGSTRNLTPGLAKLENFYNPIISPDGSTWAAEFNVYDGVHGHYGVVRKPISGGKPGIGDYVAVAEFGQGGYPMAFSRDGSILTLRYRATPGQHQGWIYRAGSGLERLPNNGSKWIEWGMDVSDDGRIVSWQPAECPDNVIICYDRPGQYIMRLS